MMIMLFHPTPPTTMALVIVCCCGICLLSWYLFVVVVLAVSDILVHRPCSSGRGRNRRNEVLVARNHRMNDILFTKTSSQLNINELCQLGEFVQSISLVMNGDWHFHSPCQPIMNSVHSAVSLSTVHNPIPPWWLLYMLPCSFCAASSILCSAKGLFCFGWTLPHGLWRQFQPSIYCFLAATILYWHDETISGDILFTQGCMLPVVAGGATAAEIVMVRADLKKNERGSTRKIQTVVFVWGGR